MPSIKASTNSYQHLASSQTVQHIRVCIPNPTIDRDLVPRSVNKRHLSAIKGRRTTFVLAH